MPKEITAYQADDGSIHATACAAATCDLEAIVKASELSENGPYAKKLVEWLTSQAPAVIAVLTAYRDACPIESEGSVASESLERTSRAIGMERFVISYGENTPLGPRRVEVANDQWPLWARKLRPIEPEAAKIACGLRQIAQNMLDRSNRDVAVVNDDHGFDLEAHAQYADRINGFAAELELIAGSPLMITNVAEEG